MCRDIHFSCFFEKLAHFASLVSIRLAYGATFRLCSPFPILFWDSFQIFWKYCTRGWGFFLGFAGLQLDLGELVKGLAV